MILAHNEIKAALDSGAWTAHRDGRRIGSDELTINSNSVNVSLGDKYLEPVLWADAIDLHDGATVEWRPKKICGELFIGRKSFYLAHVRERFDCSAPLEIGGRLRYFAPMIEGRSSVARCGLSVHSTAGFAEHGFNANFTLEITSAMPVLIRPGDEVAQIFFTEVSSATEYSGVYSDQYDEPRSAVLGRERFRRFE